MGYAKELLKGNTDSILLSLLHQQPMHGYQIIKELERRSQGYFRFPEGTLYPALHRLERKGLLSSLWERLPGGKERKVYHVTPKGERALVALTQEWQSFALAVNLILLPEA